MGGMLHQSSILQPLASVHLSSTAFLQRPLKFSTQPGISESINGSRTDHRIIALSAGKENSFRGWGNSAKTRQPWKPITEHDNGNIEDEEEKGFSRVYPSPRISEGTRFVSQEQQAEDKSVRRAFAKDQYVSGGTEKRKNFNKSSDNFAEYEDREKALAAERMVQLSSQDRNAGTKNANSRMRFEDPQIKFSGSRSAGYSVESDEIKPTRRKFGGKSRDRGKEENEIEGRPRRRKEPSIKEQIQFSCPLGRAPHIAILGGGMSGLVCALTLEQRGIKSTVFDTGKHGLGGRLGTREIINHDGLHLVFDHAAQYFTVSDPRFQKLVDHWLSEGIVKEWNGVVGSLKSGQFSELPPAMKYIAVDGMRHLADHMVSERRLININRPCWISNMDFRNEKWALNENGRPEGDYDAVVIAHNGKCANRLLAPSGAPVVAKQMKRLELSSIWALLAAFEKPLPSPSGIPEGRVMDGAFVRGLNPLSWIGNNTTKLRNRATTAQCYTAFSTSIYGKKHKVPQESIPAVKAERIKREMLHAIEIALGIPDGSLPPPIYTRVQLWGAALPLNTPNVPCIFDAYGRVGICGDWLLGSSLEAAALSGMELAHHIADYAQADDANADDFCIGLDAEFKAVEGHDIGQFPGTSPMFLQQGLEPALTV